MTRRRCALAVAVPVVIVVGYLALSAGNIAFWTLLRREPQELTALVVNDTSGAVHVVSVNASTQRTAIATSPLAANGGRDQIQLPLGPGNRCTSVVLYAVEIEGAAQRGPARRLCVGDTWRVTAVDLAPAPRR